MRSAERTKELSARPLETFGVAFLQGGYSVTRLLISAICCNLLGMRSAERTKGLSARLLETFGVAFLHGGYNVTRLLISAICCNLLGMRSAERTKGLSARPLETFGVAFQNGRKHKGSPWEYRKVVRSHRVHPNLRFVRTVCPTAQSCPPAGDPLRFPPTCFQGDRKKYTAQWL
jgi:hypothetical protein